jgi:hypothetical protein
MSASAERALTVRHVTGELAYYLCMAGRTPQLLQRVFSYITD